MPKHLPILNQKQAPLPGDVPPPEEPDARPPWHWSAISGVATCLLWVPLAMVATSASRMIVGRIVPGETPMDVQQALAAAPPELLWQVRIALIAPALVATLVASTLAGAMVGRFGGRAGPREAAVGGAATALVVWGVTLLGGAVWASVVLVVPLALLLAGTAWLGAKLAKPTKV